MLTYLQLSIERRVTGDPTHGWYVGWRHTVRSTPHRQWARWTAVSRDRWLAD